MSEWANGWVKYHTGGAGNCVTTAMEDPGTLQSLTFLDAMGRAEKTPRPDSSHRQQFRSAARRHHRGVSLAETNIGSYVAYLPAVDAGHRVASVVRALLRGWSTYRDPLALSA